MKRSHAILVVILLLVMMIGWERWGRGVPVAADEEWEERARAGREGPRSREGRSGESVREGRLSGRGGARPGESDHEVARGHGGIGFDGSAGPVAPDLPMVDEAPPLFFVRVSSIVPSAQPSDEQIERLREAVGRVARDLRPGAIILDADANSTSEAPVLLFASDRFDLSSRVKVVYDAMDRESGALAAAAGGGATSEAHNLPGDRRPVP